MTLTILDPRTGKKVTITVPDPSPTTNLSKHYTFADRVRCLSRDEVARIEFGD